MGKAARPILCNSHKIEVFRLNYDESIAYIHSLEKFGINPGLERISALCDSLGNPQDSLQFIHVAGTNGKGSTSTMLSGIMQAAGYKTGLFTSPYVVDFCERIQIDGKMISHDELAEIVSETEPIIMRLAANGVQPTEFEAVTAAALLYFARKSCKIVVLEVGLGGRFDATNIIKTPLVSVITSISMDHMAVLGDTIEKIAMEKCGIIKQNGITVSYPEQSVEALAVIIETAKQRNNQLFIPSVKDIRIIDEGLYGTKAAFDGLEVFVPFMGEHMVLNASVAVETARLLAQNGLAVSDENIADGIAAAKMPVRMEIVKKEPLIIMDGGHNEGCANALAACIEKHLKGRQITAVCGMMSDKDYDTYLKITAPLFKTFIAAKPAISRALNAETLSETAKKYCKNCMVIENPQEALQKALDLSGKGDVIIICGSFYLAGELRKQLLDF